MNGEEKLANAIRDFLISETPLSQTGAIAGIDSPIEALFFKAILYGSKIGATYLGVIFDDPSDFQELTLKKQIWVFDDWPVDFLFIVSDESGKLHKLVVECDGHEFHERTKDQAKRDRSRDRRLQESGYLVFRFTGSEIYRDAFGCALQVFRWAEKMALSETGE